MIRLLGILVSLIIVATVAVAVTMDKKGEKKDMEETMTAKAIFAGGCFWCMEPPFEKLDGVHAVVSGYIDGHKENPTYQEVSSGTTGHTEAVEITYDPNKISFAELLEVFWMNIDPTDAGGLGGAQHAQGDLTAVRNQNLLEHRRPPYSGMLSCFFHGICLRLVLSCAKARQTRLRVERGWITSSMNPSSAALYGLAKVWRYSSM